MIAFQIAQIQTGNANADYFINAFLLQYGAAATLVLIFVAYFAYTLWRQNKRTDENEQFVLKTAKDGQETKDELIKLKDEYHAFKLTSASEKGVQDGRIIELSDTVKRQQEKFDEREKVLQREIDRLTKESAESKERLAKLEEELQGKKAELEKVTSERDAQKQAIADLERDKLELESQIESLKRTIAEQSEQIISLGTQLADAVAVTTQFTTAVTPNPIETQNETKEDETK
jgi:predicted  nucleic acid-binding Zn-ribbon protein